MTLGRGQGRVSGSYQVMRLVADGVVLPLEATRPVWGEIAELWVSSAGVMLFGGGTGVTVPIPLPG